MSLRLPPSTLRACTLLVALLVQSHRCHAGGGEAQHWIYFDLDRERIREAAFLETPAIIGARLKYTWRELETSIGLGTSGKLYPEGFTPSAYAEGVRANLGAARRAFRRSAVIQYANFMPGEWLPWEDRGYLRSVYACAESLGAGVGGPDVLPHRRGQRNHSYPLIAKRAAGIRAGIAVQDGNLAQTNPRTGQRVTVAELASFACDSLRADDVFWGTEEPYYSRDVLPFLQAPAR